MIGRQIIERRNPEVASCLRVIKMPNTLSQEYIKLPRPWYDEGPHFLSFFILKFYHRHLPRPLSHVTDNVTFDIVVKRKVKIC